MKKVMYMHFGSGNHGCEAIIRSSAPLLGRPEEVALWSMKPEEDRRYGALKGIGTTLASEELRRFSPAWLEARLRQKLLRRSDGTMEVFTRELFRGNVALCVGGDNYCYGWSAGKILELNRYIRKWSAATVLWGCSVDPQAVTGEVAEELARYDLITARESMTWELLRRINSNTVLVADPAFLLPREELPLPPAFVPGNTVGINASPLILKYGDDGALILKNYENLIRFILDETTMNVCLIPHVVWEGNDDRQVLRQLYDAFRATGRVCLLDDHTAPQLKGFIARCRFFVGARTHAVIAAYSSGVPTLAVGYSVKARGIARDLLGTEEGNVLPVQELAGEDALKRDFCRLMEREEELRGVLCRNLPEYLSRSRAAAGYLETFK